MLSSRWHKVINDLWGNTTRTLLIVLSIAVGLFALGMIVSARKTLSTEMAKSYAAINPASGTIRTLEPLTQDFLDSVRHLPPVQEADGRAVVQVRVQLETGAWRSVNAVAVAHYDRMRVNRVLPQSGAWPPRKRELLIERSAVGVLGLRTGDRVLVESQSRKKMELTVAGLAHDLSRLPAAFDTPTIYISFETLELLGEPRADNELQIIARQRRSKQDLQYALNQVKDKAEKNGYTILSSITSEPDGMPLGDMLKTILLLLGTLGGLSMILSAFLIVNSISALLAQQTQQIGVMKAIGARTGQIAGMYLALVLLYGLAALLLAVPLSVVGARELSRYLAGMLNFDLAQVRVPPEAVGLQIVTGLGVPVLASLYPFVASLRVTATEAISGARSSPGRWRGGGLSGLMSGANLWFARYVVTRPWLLALRNTFRRPGRLLLTLTTLTLAGAILIGVFSVRASMFRVVDDFLWLWNFDVSISLGEPQRIELVEREALREPGVTGVDNWFETTVRLVRADKKEKDDVFFVALYPQSPLTRPPVMTQGRWLLPEDQAAIVINTSLLKRESDLRVGDDVTLKLNGRQTTWRIVGVFQGSLFPLIYANYTPVARLLGETGRTNTLLARTTSGDDPATPINAAIETRLRQAGVNVAWVWSTVEERAKIQSFFDVVIGLLLIMTFLLALVGGLGLTGAMGINVLERTREIGVMRAIGARDRSVAGVFIVEGIAIGVLSWLLSIAASLPLGRALINVIGPKLLGSPLTCHFSMTGVLLWLGLVVVLSTFASLLPARSAARLTVREVLAYE